MPFPLKTVPNPSTRSCGTCTHCCTSLGVSEVGKGLWERCQYLCKEGCDIYTIRPESCRTFQCLWLSGHIEGDERRRPDNMGLMFTNIGHSAIGEMIGCWEVRPGALQEPGNQYFLTRLADRIGIYIWPYGEKTKRKIMGRADLLSKIDKIEEHGDFGDALERVRV